MASANQTPGGYKFAPLVASQQGRANQHELACFGLSMYVYDHTYIKSMYLPGEVVNPARGQLNRENEYFPVRVRA